MLPPTSAFAPPPWSEPLDAERAIAAMPSGATIAGMFFQALLEGAQRRQVELAFSRARYLPFGFYPVVEFARLLVAAAPLFYPRASLRQALRLIGKAGPTALLSSTLGKVTLGAAEGVHAVVTAVAKTYSVNVRPCRCEVLETRPRSMILSLDDVPHFLDCHHVGVFEGCIEYAGVTGEILIHRRGDRAADLLMRW